MKYCTKQGRLILAIIAEHGHMTAEEVHTVAKESLPKIAVGTVYRVLNDLASDGLIMRIPVPDAPDRFDRTVTPHQHVICPDCGSVKDLEVKGLAELLKNAVGRDDYDFCLTVRAKCSACKEGHAEAV